MLVNVILLFDVCFFDESFSSTGHSLIHKRLFFFFIDSVNEVK